MTQLTQETLETMLRDSPDTLPTDFTASLDLNRHAIIAQLCGHGYTIIGDAWNKEIRAHGRHVSKPIEL